MTEPGGAPKRVAMLIEDEFDDTQVIDSLAALRSAAVEVVLVAPLAGRPYTGQRGTQVCGDLAAGKARAKDFDAVVIPAGKPVAAICHGPQLLISVNALRGRSVTCWPSIAIDVKNAGGLYMDKPVVEDGPIITARKSDDIPHFVDAIVRAITRA